MRKRPPFLAISVAALTAAAAIAAGTCSCGDRGLPVSMCVGDKSRAEAARMVVECVRARAGGGVEPSGADPVTHCKHAMEEVLARDFCVSRQGQWVPCAAELGEELRRSCAEAGWRP